MNIKRSRAFIISTLVLLISVLASTAPASAHQSGCHRWHSCPSDTGSYVCGDLGYTSECGNTAAPTPTPTPTVHQPVVTTKNLTSDVALPFSTITKKTNQEYRGYKHMHKTGVSGVKRVYTEVTVTDGAESSRKVAKEEVIKQPENEIVLVGTRNKPEAKVNSVTKTGNKDKFDISGKAKSNSEVVLAINDKRIKRAKTDNKGNFTFKNIKLASAKTRVQIYSRINGKESLISEKTTVNNSTGKYNTEYSNKLQY